VCLKAIAKKPEDRYPTAREMRNALRIAVGDAWMPSSGAIALAGPPRVPNERSSSVPTITPPPAARKLRANTWAGIALAVAISALVIVLARSRQPNPASPTTPTENAAPAPIDDSKGSPPSASPNDTPDPLGMAPGAPPASANTEPVLTAKPRAPAAARSDVARSANKASLSSDLAKTAATATTSPSPAAQHPPAAAMPVAPRPVDPALAYVEIGTATHLIGTTSANVVKALTSSKIDACYRALVTQSGAPEGPATLHIQTNEDGVVTEARLEARLGASLANCVGTAVRGRKIANVDTGSASADVPLVFKLR
jgi:hypothetical protein